MMEEYYRDIKKFTDDIICAYKMENKIHVENFDNKDRLVQNINENIIHDRFLYNDIEFDELELSNKNIDNEYVLDLIKERFEKQYKNKICYKNNKLLLCDKTNINIYLNGSYILDNYYLYFAVRGYVKIKKIFNKKKIKSNITIDVYYVNADNL